ncbi:hypothetical protein COA01_23255 [Bacillus cereus]|uniref:hypothetical protein n=1 Tax=Bacillus cereus TaxID=1396 RepID=UPI000BFC6CD9|nr:hypothetical protein [Bacillus cereus]PGP18663.1 hypothetical protein COA01_23255 [Bacillus cereus]
MNFLNTIKSSATNEVEVLYSLQEAAEAVRVKPSTISKYCTALDKQGYQFEKKPDGSRKLREQEIAIFRKIGELKLKEKSTVEKAIETIVLAWQKDMHIESVEKPAEVTTEQVLEMFKEVMNGMHQINTRLNTMENNISELKGQQLQLSAPSEEILAIGTSIEKQNNDLNEVKSIMQTIYEETSAIKEQQLQLSAPSEEILAIGNSIEKQSNEFNEVKGLIQTIHEETVGQIKILHNNTELMKEFEKKASEQESSIPKVVKEIMATELELHKKDNSNSIERIEEINKNTIKTVDSLPTIVKDIVSQEMQTHKEEKNKSDEFMKEFAKQSQQAIDTGIQKAVQETMKQQELKNNQPRRGWLRRFLGK